MGPWGMHSNNMHCVMSMHVCSVAAAVVCAINAVLPIFVWQPYLPAQETKHHTDSVVFVAWITFKGE